MFIYIILFAIALILGLVMLGKNPTKTKKIVYLSVVFVLMFIVTTFRYGMGNDYFNYMRITDQIINAGWSKVFGLGFEPLYVLLIKFLSLITHNHEIMYALLAALILAPIAISIYKHSDNAWISVCVYLCLTFFYTQLNFIRQSLAVSLLILAYGFMKKRKIVPVLILAFAATLFHYTAAIFIPFYLISLIKPTKKYLIIYGSVSVGSLILCLILKAVGANPMNLLAHIATAITGKNYADYIGSNWFELGFGPQYLIMPVAVLVLVLVSYFLGWKEKEEAPMLLQLTLLNTSVWSFITYAYIVERFSMFIFIFSLFTIPSVLNYYAEKADAAKKAAESASKNKKEPGYSKKHSEEKSDNSFLLTTVSIICMFIYNCWSLGMNFHGVNPYIVMFPAVQDVIDGVDSSEDNLHAYLQEMDLYCAFVHLKNVDNAYVAISTSDSYNGVTNAMRRGAKYADIGIFSRSPEEEANAPGYIEYNNRNGELFIEDTNTAVISYTTENGVEIVNNGKEATITDYKGKSVSVEDNCVAIILFEDDGTLIGGIKYKVNIFRKTAAPCIPS